MPVFLALDFPNWQETERFIYQNNFQGVPVKVGMELFYREGPEIIYKLKENDHAIFLDLKLHDIPTTVYKAMKNLSHLGVDVTNVHALGGSKMIQAAKQGLGEGGAGGNQTKLLAVTVLTSMDDRTFASESLIKEPVEATAIHLARLAKQNGADGVVCSPLEVPIIKQQCGSAFYAITPGIRLEKDSKQDQQRTAHPQQAKELGSDAIVIGRSVTAAADPAAAYINVMKEWDNVQPL
ncbi:orotidine-5'-phosphate decarboxylase [Sediminibacillus albus]|uniref:Orotidine 5'-phosphate decarboxylase n=1 Tax=Sediminibacillus albus TaxID=407036 RepID=A0A1G8W7T5_9BACI|nr:orotidine-5'-phosphate decarboxylase [Sediminibacillus albus]SDJ73570.1 orotidine-5'-phosphate decarboxylase [Sediminibacillus albus]